MLSKLKSLLKEDGYFSGYGSNVSKVPKSFHRGAIYNRRSIYLRPRLHLRAPYISRESSTALECTFEVLQPQHQIVYLLFMAKRILNGGAESLHENLIVQQAPTRGMIHRIRRPDRTEVNSVSKVPHYPIKPKVFICIE